ncbi:hypothetical protein NIES2104_45330 [Leptolyngbya sp. NIES-2104]|nr:hypothetical protein NIES2104_45330 [Leptolyngbya sp. NIES-2104]
MRSQINGSMICSMIQRTNFSILEAPSILGLSPLGVRQPQTSLLHFGLP